MVKRQDPNERIGEKAVEAAAQRKMIQRKADAKRAGLRTRAWTTIVYPDSAPANWQEILREQLVEGLISPLHDKDLLPDGSGETKKPHWHVVISFKSPTTQAKAEEVFSAIGGVGCFKVKDFKQMARYLCHLDQPDKHRYDMAEVVTIGAIDYAVLAMSAADEDAVIDDMIDFVDDYDIRYFSDFVVMLRKAHPEWRRFIYHKYAGFMARYINDRRQKIFDEEYKMGRR